MLVPVGHDTPALSWSGPHGQSKGRKRMFGTNTQLITPPADGYHDDDAALVAGLQAGDARAVEHLVTHYGPILYRFAYYQLQDAMQAEDLVSEVFMRVTEK